MADSGASINILDENEYHRLTNRPKFEWSSVKIYGYRSKVPLRVLGKFDTTLESETKKLNAKLYVVEGSGGSLLSWKTSQALRLLQTIQQVKDLSSKPDTKGPANLIEEYDDLFHGLGKLKNYQVKLHIDEVVPPVAQPHRRVPFHVPKQLEEQLRRDEELGVMARIEGPTPWVSPIVVAPKPKSPGKVRVCVDMRQANKAVKRERHMHVTPTVKEMIGDLNGARVFSKLDLNQGFIHHNLRHTHGSHALQTSQLRYIKCCWNLPERDSRDAGGHWWCDEHQWRHTGIWQDTRRTNSIPAFERERFDP